MSQSLGRQYTKFVSQNIFGMLGISIYILADTFYISKAAGADGITVLNLCLPLYNLIYAIGSMIGAGSATRFTLYKVQKDPVCDCFFSNAIFCSIIISIPFILAGLIVPDRVLKLMGGDSSIVALGVPYARIFMMFAPFFMINFVVNAFVRNDNAPSTAMVATLLGSLFNIIFDYIFMFPMGMGMAGAALATAISPIVSTCVCGTHFIRGHNQIRFLWQKPSLQRLVQACQLGTPAFIGEFSSGVTTTTFNFLILRLAGNVGVAAYGVIANLALVATSMFNGVAQGSQPLVSSYYGKGDRRSAGKLLKYGLLTSLCIAVLAVVGTRIGTDILIAIFNSEGSQELRNLAYDGIRIYFPGFLFAGLNITATGYLSATDCALQALAASFSRGVVAIILCAFVLAHFFGMTGVWYSFMAAELITLLLVTGMLLWENRSKGQQQEKA